MRVRTRFSALLGLALLAGAATAAPLPGFDGRALDAESMVSRTVRPGEVLLYVTAGHGVTVADRGGGFSCSDNSRCVFTVRVGATVVLTGQGAGPGRGWSGCDASADQRRCVITMGASPVRVTLN